MLYAYNLPKTKIKTIKLNSLFSFLYFTLLQKRYECVCVSLHMYLCEQKIQTIECVQNVYSSSSSSNNDDLNDGNDYHEQRAHTHIHTQTHTQYSVQFRREMHARSTNFAVYMNLHNLSVLFIRSLAIYLSLSALVKAFRMRIL